MLLSSMFTFLPHAYATFEIYMEPSTNDFDTSTVAPCYRWNITFYARDIPSPGAFAFQFKCFFDPAFLNVTGAWLASGDHAYIFFGKPTTAPIPFINIVGGSVLVGDSLLGPFIPPTSGAGPFKLGMVEFHITAAPGKYETLYSDLDINNLDTFLLDESLSEITPMTKTSGYVSYTWLGCYGPDVEVQIVDPGLPGVTLLNPQTVEFDQYHIWNCTNFDVEVRITDLNAGWGLQNASFTLSYNSSLTDLVTAAVDPSWTTFTMDTTTLGIVDVFVADYATPPPSGDVLIITITFHIIGQGETISTARDYSHLDFSNVMLWDTVAPINLDEIKNGLIIVYRFWRS